MVKSTFNNIKIAALATTVPMKWTPVEDLMGTTDVKKIQRFKKKTGVEGKYDANEKQTSADLCYIAAKETLKHRKDIPIEKIGLLVFVTQTPDYAAPSTACVLQHRLHLSENCLAFDVNLGCSGLVYGMNITCSILNSSNTDYALLLVGDTFGKRYRKNINEGLLDEKNNDAKLFGDAGAALLFEKVEQTSRMDMAMCTCGRGFDKIIIPYGGERHCYGPKISKMDGIGVFNFAIDKPPALIKELMNEIGTVPKEYDCLALHQANCTIMRQIAKETGFSNEQNLISINRFGNTNAPSIATALTQRYGNVKEGAIKAMLCGFGIGLSWGAVSVQLNAEDILPLIQTDEYFDDGYEDYTEGRF